jgi:hypothetical protein
LDIGGYRSLAFAGLGARHCLVSAAVWASKANGVLGFLVFVLVRLPASVLGTQRG